MDWAWKLLGLLVPPKTGDEHVDAWRVRIARMTWLNSVSIICMLLAAANQVPWISGVAQKSDVAALMLLVTEDRLPMAVDAFCEAGRGADKQKLDLTGSRLAVLLTRYKSLTGQAYPLTECRAN